MEVEMKIASIAAVSLIFSFTSTFAETRIELSPLHGDRSENIFVMYLVEREQDGSGTLFDFTITMIDKIPVSSLSGSYVCSQGIRVCGVSYDGENDFEPTFILLDGNLNEIGRLCDLEYIFSYPSFSFLFRFDWSLPDEGLTYYTADKIPPDFTGIESWRAVANSCTGDVVE